MILIGILIGIAALLGGPFTWLLMLALGNFGFVQFGFVDCIPAGIILAALAVKGGTSD
jgi:hypothetical protein